MFQYYIKEEDWTKIYNYLQSRKDIYCANEVKMRHFFEGIFYVLRGGIQWRLVPFCYGKWRSLHKKFREWCKKNIWQDMLNYFGQDADMEYFMIDTTVVRAHSCASGYAAEGLGRSRGGFTSKIHAAVNALGNVLKIFTTPGQQSDISKASDLIDNV